MHTALYTSGLACGGLGVYLLYQSSSSEKGRAIRCRQRLEETPTIPIADIDALLRKQERQARGRGEDPREATVFVEINGKVCVCMPVCLYVCVYVSVCEELRVWMEGMDVNRRRYTRVMICPCIYNFIHSLLCLRECFMNPSVQICKHTHKLDTHNINILFVVACVYIQLYNICTCAYITDSMR